MTPSLAKISSFDLYGPIHKGLRLAMAELLVRIGRTDFACPYEGEEALAEVARHLRIVRAHLAHEDKHVHAALEARLPGSTRELEAEHLSHRAALFGLEELTADLLAARLPERQAGARELYNSLARFAAEDFTHMAHEEGAISELMHRHFTDAELQAIEAAILADLKPELASDMLSLILRAASPAEQLARLEAMQAGLPHPAFVQILKTVARPTMRALTWRQAQERFCVAA